MAVGIFDTHRNLALGTIATAPSPATSGTSVTLTSGQVSSRFGNLTPPFYATLWPANTQPDLSNAEIVRVTANPSGDQYTITRAQGGTTAKSVAVGWQIAATFTAEMLQAIEDSMFTPLSELIAFGHSLTTGYGGSSPEFSWPHRLMKLFGGGELAVYGQNGAQLVYDDSNSTADGGVMTVFKWARRNGLLKRTSGPYLAPWGAMSFHYGANDTHLFGTGASVQAAVKAHFRALIGVARCARWYQDNDAAITKGGSHSQLTGSEDNVPAGRFDYITAVSGTNNYWELAVPSDFPGGTVWLFTVAQTTNGFVADVKVDGGTSGIAAINGVAGATTVDCKGDALVAGINGIQAFKIDIPASGSHTLRITPTSIDGGAAAINGFGIEAEQPPIVMLPNMHKLPSYAWGSGLPSPPSDSMYDTLNGWISAVAAECSDGRVIVPDVDAAINKGSRYIYSDGLHLNDDGADAAAAAAYDALRKSHQLTARATTATAKKGSVAVARQNVKRPVRAAATGNVSISSAPSTVDGVTPDYFDTFLLPLQTTGAECGIYRWLGATKPMEREHFTDTDQELYGGVEVNVQEGTAHGKSKWKLTTTGVITPGTTTQSWRRMDDRVLFDHFADGNSGTSETDIYNDSTPGGILAFDGDKIEAIYGGVTVLHASRTKQIRLYFGGTLIYDSTAQATSTADDWELRATIIRVSSSSVRCVISMRHTSAAAWTNVKNTTVTGLTLTNAQALRLTGTLSSGSSATDLVGKLARVEFLPAAG